MKRGTASCVDRQTLLEDLVVGDVWPVGGRWPHSSVVGVMLLMQVRLV